MSPIPLLAVCFYFPPWPEPRAIQVSRLVRSTPELAWTVACAAPDPERNDPTVSPGIEEHCRILRIPFTQGLAMRLDRKFKLRTLSLMPDRRRDWVGPVAREVERGLAGSEPPRALVTFGQPWTDHLAGLAIKRRHGLPWIAHFSDPWSRSPYRQASSLVEAWNRRAEARVVQEADRLLFPWQELLDRVMAPYPEAWRAKARVLPPIFTPEQPLAGSHRPGRRRVIRYMGTFYGIRRPEPLLAALHAILRESPGLLADVAIEIIGDFPPPQPGLLAGLPEGLVSFHPRVPLGESLRLMAEADALMSLDAPDISIVPSKLIDYIAAERPILAITPDGGSTPLVQALGGWTARPGDEAGIAAMLKDFLSRPTPASPWGEVSVRERFAAPSVAGIFQEVVGELVG